MLCRYSIYMVNLLRNHMVCLFEISNSDYNTFKVDYNDMIQGVKTKN
jgi:hypothetical protein